MSRFEVEFYETTSGNQPAKDFLLSLDKKMRAKMMDTISSFRITGMSCGVLIVSICQKVYLSLEQKWVLI